MSFNLKWFKNAHTISMFSVTSLKIDDTAKIYMIWKKNAAKGKQTAQQPTQYLVESYRTKKEKKKEKVT